MADFIRTANAGGLLELDGVRMLLDGVSAAQGDYPATPPAWKAALARTPLDLMAFTHAHGDHFVTGAAEDHPETVLLGPADVAGALPGRRVLSGPVPAGPVRVVPVPTRHQGKTLGEAGHLSFLIEGTLRVWFTGDAAPGQWRDLPAGLARPDVLIAPFVYANTPAAWRAVEAIRPGLLVVVHLPEPARDRAGLGRQVHAVLRAHPEQAAILPEMGERVELG